LLFGTDFYPDFSILDDFSPDIPPQAFFKISSIFLSRPEAYPEFPPDTDQGFDIRSTDRGHASLTAFISKLLDAAL
jgi:hypothetical protein